MHCNAFVCGLICIVTDCMYSGICNVCQKWFSKNLWLAKILAPTLNMAIYASARMVEGVSDWWSGAYLKGLTLPKDLRHRGTFGGPRKKKKKMVEGVFYEMAELVKKQQPIMLRSIFSAIFTQSQPKIGVFRINQCCNHFFRIYSCNLSQNCNLFANFGENIITNNNHNIDLQQST
jgi:hypothetical protein